jgi:transposase-like protein
MKFVSYADRKQIAAGMRTIYTAPSLEAAELAFAGFEADFGERYPGAVDVWRRAWNEFIPFLDYPPELRLIVYTTNAIESINFQLRKITKNRGHFPVGRGGDETTLPRVAEYLQQKRGRVRNRNAWLDNGPEHIGGPLPRTTPSMIE